MAATAEALRRHPVVNSEWRDDGLLLKPEINIGMAVALDEGLIVPVIKHADELSLAGIARQVNDLAQRARAGQLKPDEVQGGTFTITNHGVAGSLFATPIINQPQIGNLGRRRDQKARGRAGGAGRRDCRAPDDVSLVHVRSPRARWRVGGLVRGGDRQAVGGG